MPSPRRAFCWGALLRSQDRETGQTFITRRTPSVPAAYHIKMRSSSYLESHPSTKAAPGLLSPNSAVPHDATGTQLLPVARPAALHGHAQGPVLPAHGSCARRPAQPLPPFPHGGTGPRRGHPEGQDAGSTGLPAASSAHTPPPPAARSPFVPCCRGRGATTRSISGRRFILPNSTVAVL